MDPASDSDSDTDAATQAVRNFNGLVKLYYQNPEIAEDMRKLSSSERAGYVGRIRDKLAVAFRVIHELWRSKRMGTPCIVCNI
jgi:hypothetical protein